MATPEISQATTTGIMAYMPSIDGQTIFSIIVGAVLSIALFWLGYKKTVGAKEERIRAVNQDLVSSILRRVAVERQSVNISQFQDIRTAKAYKASLEPERLISFSDTLAIVLSDTIDNNFLDNTSKATVIDLIKSSKDSDTSIYVEPSKKRAKDFTSVLLPAMAATSALVGAVGSFVSTFAVDKSINDWVKDATTRPEKINAIYLLLTLMVLTLTAVTALIAIFTERQRIRSRADRSNNAS